MDTLPQPHPWVDEQRSGPRFGFLTQPSGDWPKLRELAQAAEEAGFDSLWLADHPLVTADPWTTLAAVAEATERIRLGALASCVFYRHPAMLARVVADVDRISGGRVVLGIGSGDFPPEFAALGLEFPPAGERHATLEEALEILRPLLAGQPVTYEGRRLRVTNAVLVQPPVQQPRIPILIAGGSRRTMRLVARHGDASNLTAASWGGAAVTADDVADRFARLRQSCDAEGRPYGSVLRTAALRFVLADTQAAADEIANGFPELTRTFFGRYIVPCTPDGAVSHIRNLIASGFQYPILQVNDPDTLRVLATRVLPEVASGAASERST